MATTQRDTHFLPAERAPETRVREDHERFRSIPHLGKSLDAVPNPVLFLNPERQIVYCNRAGLDYLKTHDGLPELGLRPGEALRCDKSHIMPGGCGTSEFCTTCGAANAIRNCQQGRDDVQECRIIDEIQTQRTLSEAETDELEPQFSPEDSLKLLGELVDACRLRDAAKGKILALDPASAAVSFRTDPTLLRRVVGNMLRNALEAVAPGQAVTAGCRREGAGIEFWVRNPGVMPREVQLQLFQRSFSTKGAGRGLGTYSMKLLTERYLKGAIGFTSDEIQGTRFAARYPLAA